MQNCLQVFIWRCGYHNCVFKMILLIHKHTDLCSKHHTTAEVLIINLQDVYLPTECDGGTVCTNQRNTKIDFCLFFTIWPWSETSSSAGFYSDSLTWSRPVDQTSVHKLICVVQEDQLTSAVGKQADVKKLTSDQTLNTQSRQMKDTVRGKCSQILFNRSDGRIHIIITLYKYESDMCI